MRNFPGKKAVVIAVSALAMGIAGLAPAAAADLDEGAPPEYSTPETYRSQGPIDERYDDRRPARVYRYVAPPPVSYYAYRRPALVVLPQYYVRPYAYRVPAYAVRHPRPYLVRRVGPYRWSGRVHRW
jgi:hypothetical protein